jgi:hypothetical protein
LAFLDQWQNYAIRFSGAYGIERLAYQPDFINCIDEIGKSEMCAEGFDPSKLYPLGHPYLTEIADSAANLNGASVKRRLGIPEDISIALFVSEPIFEHFGLSRGYDQYEALKLFLTATATNPTPICPVIKLHPKDYRERFEEVIKPYHKLSPLIVEEEATALECLTMANIVVGMTSIMLIEAYILGRPIVSLQPGLKIEDPLMLTRHGLAPRVTERQGFSLSDSTYPQGDRGFGYVFLQAPFLNLLDTIFHKSNHLKNSNL